LVHLDLSAESDKEDTQEFEELVASAGAHSVAVVIGKRSSPSPRFFVGTGKLEEIRFAVEQHQAEVVLFNHALSPSQERNLEEELQCRVLDRTGLILDIFAQRARTHEGKLQVELAQLQHMSTRLVRGWTHLERQKGGIGLRGPGETQLETDRRLLQVRVKSIQRRLDKVRGQRDQNRRSRKKADIPTVSLIGYTNAGKSTLFNQLTESEVYASDQLFATLDPTLRRLDIPELGPIVLADTVGFIRHLPHKLVESFRATLQEAQEANLLLHTVDAASAERDDNIDQVELVLAEIEADEVPVLMVYNKIDLLEDQEARIDRDDAGKPIRVWVSAVTGAGMDLLQQAITELLAEEVVDKELCIPMSDAALRARFYSAGAVLEETFNEQGDSVLHIRMPKQDFNRLVPSSREPEPWEL